MRFCQLLKYTLSLPKTFYFNFRTLPFRQAIKFPVLISYSTKLINLRKGCLVLNKSIHNKPFTIVIGFNGTEVIPPQKSMISLKKEISFLRGSVILLKDVLLILMVDNLL